MEKLSELNKEFNRLKFEISKLKYRFELYDSQNNLKKPKEEDCLNELDEELQNLLIKHLSKETLNRFWNVKKPENKTVESRIKLLREIKKIDCVESISVQINEEGQEEVSVFYCSHLTTEDNLLKIYENIKKLEIPWNLNAII